MMGSIQSSQPHWCMVQEIEAQRVRKCIVQVHRPVWIISTAPPFLPSLLSLNSNKMWNINGDPWSLVTRLDQSWVQDSRVTAGRDKWVHRAIRFSLVYQVLVCFGCRLSAYPSTKTSPGIACMGNLLSWAQTETSWSFVTSNKSSH